MQAVWHRPPVLVRAVQRNIDGWRQY